MNLEIKNEQIKLLLENGFGIQVCDCEKHLRGINYNGLPVFRLEDGLGIPGLFVGNSNFNKWCNEYLKNNISEYHQLSTGDVYHLNCTLDDYIDFIIKVKNESQKKPDTILILSKMSWD